jgi:hypothetical protein
VACVAVGAVAGIRAPSFVQRSAGAGIWRDRTKTRALCVCVCVSMWQPPLWSNTGYSSRFGGAPSFLANIVRVVGTHNRAKQRL